MELPKCHVCGKPLTIVIESARYPDVHHQWNKDKEVYESDILIAEIEVTYKCANCNAELNDENWEFFNQRQAS